MALALALPLAGAVHAQDQAIEQGKTFGDLSGAEGRVTLLHLDVPGGVEGMVIEAWGGQGNLDLFVRQGKAPDGKHFDYQSASPTNTERVSVPDPHDGTWYIGLYGRSAFSGASIRVTFQGQPGPAPAAPPSPQPVAQTQPAPGPGPLLAQPPSPEPPVGPPSPRMPAGPLPLVTPPPATIVAAPPAPPAPPTVPLEAFPLLTNAQQSVLSGQAGEGCTYRLAVPPGTTRLRLTLEGGQGQADLYLHYGVTPLPNRFSDRVSLAGPGAAVSEILDPAPGLWFIRVQGTGPFKDLRLGVHYEPAPAPTTRPG